MREPHDSTRSSAPMDRDAFTSNESSQKCPLRRNPRFRATTSAMSAACFHLFTSVRVLALTGALLAIGCDANSDSQPVTRYGSVSVTSSTDQSAAFKPFAYFY